MFLLQVDLDAQFFLVQSVGVKTEDAAQCVVKIKLDLVILSVLKIIRYVGFVRSDSYTLLEQNNLLTFPFSFLTEMTAATRRHAHSTQVVRVFCIINLSSTKTF